MAYINKIKVENSNYLIEPTLFAVTSGSASAYTATIDDNFSITTGIAIQLKFHITNNNNATLNGTFIKYNNNNITAGIILLNHIYTLVYDGTVWQLVGDADSIIYNTHVADNTIHITPEERNKWNSIGVTKSGETLIFSGTASSSSVPYATNMEF